MTEFVFVGGSTKGDRQGISIFRFNEERGELDRVGEIGGIDNPTYLTVDGSHSLVYACSETAANGGLVIYRFDPARATLAELDRQPTLGAYPCFTRISRDRRLLLAANYGDLGADPDKAVVAYSLDDNGIPQPGPLTLELSGTGPRTDRQERSHPHSVMETATDNLFAVADLGTDTLSLVRPGSGGLEIVSQVAMPAGSGPRHSRLHPGGRFMLVCGELDSTVMSFDAGFALIDSQSTLPPGTEVENTTAEIRIDPTGRHVYVSNRGQDSIAVFGFDLESGRLKSQGHVSSGGATPRNFQLTRSGNCLIAGNQSSNNLTVFRRDPKSGSLTAVSQIVEPSPTCVKSVRF